MLKTQNKWVEETRGSLSAKSPEENPTEPYQSQRAQKKKKISDEDKTLKSSQEKQAEEQRQGLPRIPPEKLQEAETTEWHL